MSKGIGGHSRPNEGRSDSWITPKHIIDALGPFDLDPCACVTQPWPCATRSYTEQENGLMQPWEGRVWLNPPYGRETYRWLRRLAHHNRGIALIFARTETDMFMNIVWRKAAGLLFLYQRLYFHYPNGERASGSSGAPSVLIAYGINDASLLEKANLDGVYISCMHWCCTTRRSDLRKADAFLAKVGPL